MFSYGLSGSPRHPLHRWFLSDSRKASHFNSNPTFPKARCSELGFRSYGPNHCPKIIHSITKINLQNARNTVRFHKDFARKIRQRRKIEVLQVELSSVKGLRQWFPALFHLRNPWQAISINCTLHIGKMFVINIFN